MDEKIVGYETKLYPPPDLPNHELNHPLPNKKKYIFTMAQLDLLGGGLQIAEMHAGWGLMSVEYRARGHNLVGCVEIDYNRYKTLQKNVGTSAQLLDNRTVLPQHLFDVDVIDFDPYDHASRCMLVNRKNIGIKPQYLFITTNLVTFRWHYKNPKVMRTVANWYMQPKNNQLSKAKGVGITKTYIVPFLKSITGKKVTFVDAVSIPSALERGLVYIK